MTSKLTHKELERRKKALEEGLPELKTCSDTKYLREQCLEDFINNTNLPVYLKDVNYKYIFINKKFELLAHVTCNQIKGKDDFDIFSRPVAELFRSQDEEVIMSRTVVEFEETIVLPDGAQTFMTAKFPLIDRQGKIYAVGGICTDITLRKTVETELKEAEEKYRGFFEHSPLGILQIDKHGIVIACNEKLAEILGSSIEEILGYNLPKYIQEEEVRSVIVSVLSGKVTHCEGEFKFGKMGMRRYLRGVFSPIFTNAGSISAAIGIIEDITTRKEVEDALKKAKSELERRVSERTAELAQRTEKLTETNFALNILLEKREKDKEEIEKNMIFNIEKLIKPHIERLKLNRHSATQEALLQIIESNLNELTSPFVHKYKNYLSELTPTQIQIANLIKQGQTTKEIASLLSLSPSTIACHRQQIRKRLFLTHSKINLQAALTAKHNN